MAIKVVSFEQESELVGEHVRIFLKSDLKNAGFTLYVTETAPGCLKGYDIERLNLTVESCDIDYVMVQDTGGMNIERFYEEQRKWEQHKQENISLADGNEPSEPVGSI